MSFFEVEICLIDKIWDHPNADRLDLASVQGLDYQFVVRRNEFKPNDKVVYFPIDSIWPEKLAKKLNMEDKLRRGNRLKTVRLRGEISQGFVVHAHELGFGDLNVGSFVTEELGVTKYEPPIGRTNFSQGARLITLPEGVSVYDIESCNRYRDLVEILKSQPVWVSEKLEGSHFSVTYPPMQVCSRRCLIEELPEQKHMFWEVARKMELADKLDAIHRKLGRFTIHGEFLGPRVQGNIYKLKEDIVYFYDIQTDSGFLNVDEMLDIFYLQKLPVAPTLAINCTLADFLQGKTVQEASDGVSMLADTAREGIVIKPMTEQKCKIGRLFLKQRGPQYLASNDN